MMLPPASRESRSVVVSPLLGGEAAAGARGAPRQALERTRMAVRTSVCERRSRFIAPVTWESMFVRELMAVKVTGATEMMGRQRP